MERLFRLRLRHRTKDKDGNEYNSNKATISGLAAQTTYYYKVDDKEIKSFKTGNTGKFRFAFVGDPQIGSSNELKGADTEAFTMHRAMR